MSTKVINLLFVEAYGLFLSLKVSIISINFSFVGYKRGDKFFTCINAEQQDSSTDIKNELHGYFRRLPDTKCDSFH